MSHCKELLKILNVDLFRDQDKKGNQTFEIILYGRYTRDQIDPIERLKDIHKVYLPDVNHETEESMIRDVCLIMRQCAAAAGAPDRRSSFCRGRS